MHIPSTRRLLTGIRISALLLLTKASAFVYVPRV